MRRQFRSIALLVSLPLLASACTLRYSQTTFKDPVLQSQRSGFSMQTGLVLFGRDHAFGRTDMQLLLNRQEFASQPKTILQNVSLSARYFPVRSGFIRPFVGGGYGQRAFFTETTVSTCPSGYICFPGYDEDFQETTRERLNTGYNPLVTFGVELGDRKAKGASSTWVIDATRELATPDGDWDFRAWRLSLGLVWRLW
jgi:hypothetical protein